jgi:hypothetical protein
LLISSRTIRVLDRHPSVTELDLKRGMVHCRFPAGQGLIIGVSGDGKAPLERGLRTHANNDPGEAFDFFPGVIGD